MGWGYAGMGWAMGLIMVLGVLGFWVAVVLIVRALFVSRSPEEHPLDPMSVLEHRYASGEISRDQFIAMRHDLLNHRPTE